MASEDLKSKNFAHPAPDDWVAAIIALIILLLAILW